METHRKFWHAYGAEVPDRCEDAEGNPQPGFCIHVYGETDRNEKQVPLTMPHIRLGSAVPFAYLATWDHVPTESDVNELLGVSNDLASDPQVHVLS